MYRFVNTEAPDEYIEITTYGDGVDSQDKAPGKAMTYSDKYALLKAYKIQTGDDPDANASEPLARIEKKPASDAVKGVIKSLCDKHDVNFEKWLGKNGVTYDTLPACCFGIAMMLPLFDVLPSPSEVRRVLKTRESNSHIWYMVEDHDGNVRTYR